MKRIQNYSPTTTAIPEALKLAAKAVREIEKSYNFVYTWRKKFD